MQSAPLFHRLYGEALPRLPEPVRKVQTSWPSVLGEAKPP
jgi:hypothetical protein